MFLVPCLDIFHKLQGINNYYTIRTYVPTGSDIGKHVYHDKRRDKHDHRDTMEVCRTEWAEGESASTCYFTNAYCGRVKFCW